MQSADVTRIVSALDRNTKAVDRLAKAQETANTIAIDIEKYRRENADVPSVR